MLRSLSSLRPFRAAFDRVLLRPLISPQSVVESFGAPQLLYCVSLLQTDWKSPCVPVARLVSTGTCSIFIPLYRHRVQCRPCLRSTLLVSSFPLPYSPSRVRARRYMRSYLLLLAASLLCTSIRSIKLIARSAYPIPRLFLFYHQASPFPFLKHRSRAQTPFRASSSPPIMSASLRLAVDGHTRPPRLQSSPSLPNLRCVQTYGPLYRVSLTAPPT